MITQFLIQMILGLIDGLFSIVPAWGIDTSSLTSVNTAAVTAGSLDGWIPEQFCFICLGILVGARLWFFVINGVQWLYHLIPFNGGS